MVPPALFEWMFQTMLVLLHLSGLQSECMFPEALQGRWWHQYNLSTTIRWYKLYQATRGVVLRETVNEGLSSGTYTCLNLTKVQEPPYTYHSHYASGTKEATVVSTCIRNFVHENGQLMVESSFPTQEGLQVNISACTTSTTYSHPVEVMVKYPWNYTNGACPFGRGVYQVTVKTPYPDSATCNQDDASQVVVYKSKITVNTCLNGNSTERPFQNVELTCLGELPAHIIGSEESKGKVFIFASNYSSIPSFYSARYKIYSAHRILMSLQGASEGKLQPRPDKKYNSAELWGKDFIYAFDMKLMDFCIPGICRERSTCRSLDNGFACECDSGYHGTDCNIYLRLRVLPTSQATHKEGEKVAMECAVSLPDHTTPPLQIFNDTNAVNCDTRGQGSNCSTEAVVVSRYDNQGKWTCTTEWAGKTYRHQTSVIVTFIATHVNLTQGFRPAASLARRVNATCKTGSANPAPVITWRRNSVPISASSSLYKTSVRAIAGEHFGKSTESTLSFVVSKDLLGTSYDCALLSQQPVLYSSQSMLKGFVAVAVEGYTGPLYQGDDISLICQVLKGNITTLKFEWIFTARSTREPQTVARSQAYTKSNVAFADTGAYLCKASSLAGDEDEDSIIVEILSNDGNNASRSRQAQNNGEDNTGIIVGSVLGVLCVVAAVAGISYLYLRRKPKSGVRKKLMNYIRNSSPIQPTPQPTPTPN